MKKTGSERRKKKEKLQLVYLGASCLRERAKEIAQIDQSVRNIVEQMYEMICDERHLGIGLAAPQVNYSIRLFVTLKENGTYEDKEGNYIAPSREELKVYINPKLSNPGQEKESSVEGCLSLPGVRGFVERPKIIRVEAMDLDGNIFHEKLEGLEARIVMHENDHLNGVLFIDRMDAAEKKRIRKKIRELKKSGLF